MSTAAPAQAATIASSSSRGSTSLNERSVSRDCRCNSATRCWPCTGCASRTAWIATPSEAPPRMEQIRNPLNFMIKYRRGDPCGRPYRTSGYLRNGTGQARPLRFGVPCTSAARPRGRSFHGTNPQPVELHDGIDRWHGTRRPRRPRGGDPCGRPRRTCRFVRRDGTSPSLRRFAPTLAERTGWLDAGRDNAARRLVASPSGPSPHRPRTPRLAAALRAAAAVQTPRPVPYEAVRECDASVKPLLARGS